MIKEFKAFAMKGNLVDMAVGIILGLAFGKIITSFVSDVLMPPIGLILGKVDFSNLFINLSAEPYASLAAAKAAGAPVIRYGLFLNTVLDFVIVAFVLFMFVRQMNRFKAVEVPGRACPFCFSSINDKATRCPQCTSELTETK